MSSEQEEKSTRCNGNLDCPASLTHRSNCLSRYRGTEFGKWWATKKAEGYDYGYEALENVQFGFEAGASSLAEKQEEIEKLKRILVKAAIPYEALIIDTESRKWIAPSIWSAMQNAAIEARAVLNPISEPQEHES